MTAEPDPHTPPGPGAPRYDSEPRSEPCGKPRTQSRSNSPPPERRR
ncbi:hypothetical protein [Streptomyces sp. YIM 132580]|nr:hypothetical protein [Streptomyces sp. YIM 132580]